MTGLLCLVLLATLSVGVWSNNHNIPVGPLKNPSDVPVDGEVLPDGNGPPDPNGNEFNNPVFGNCQSNSCPNVTAPLNRQAVVGGTAVGDTVSFSCDGDYTLCGADMIVCTSSGEWSASPPVCVPPYNGSSRYAVDFGNSTYDFVITPQLLLREALDDCSDIGGYVVAINSEEEDEFLRCVAWMIDVETGDNTWMIGQVLNNTSGEWSWDSGEPITYTNYFDNQGGNCRILARNNQYEWTPSTCGDNDEGYICEVPIL